MGVNTIRALHSDGANLYCGTWSGDVFIIPLGGGTWTDWGLQAVSGNGAYEFFEAGGLLFKASNNGVKYKSLTGGSWNLLGTDVSGFRSFASDGTYLYAGHSAGVKRILLSGLGDWESFGSGLPGATIWALQIVGGRLLAGVDSGEVYSVPLTGGAWEPYGAGLYDGSTVGAFLLNGQMLYIGTGEFSSGGSGAWQADVGAP